MQIHELNNYNGELNSDAFVAIDNGSDTGKVSVTGLLADTNADISALDTFLNARIDNIIAGGTAPSASEIVDARLGADGVTYASLGDAIRDQVSDLKSDIDDICDAAISFGRATNNIWSDIIWTTGYVAKDGSISSSSSYKYSNKIAVKEGDVIAVGTAQKEIRFLCAYSDSSTAVANAGSNDSVTTYTVPAGIHYIVISVAASYSNVVITHEQTTMANNLADNVSELEDAMEEITDIVLGDPTTISPLTWTSGYTALNGQVYSNSTLEYSSQIPVKKGDVIKVYRGSDGGLVPSARFLTTYKDGEAVPSLGSESEAIPYTVPDGVDAIVITIASSYGNAIGTKASLTITTGVDALQDIVASMIKNNIAYTFNLTAGNTYIGTENLEDMCGYRICFFAKANGLNGEIRIGKGAGAKYGASVGVDSTNLYEYLGASATPARTQAHGLTIKDYIGIVVDAHYKANATVTLFTNGGSYTWDVSYWLAHKGVLTVYSQSDNLTDCNLAYTCEGLIKETWMFGDSYFSNSANAKWTYYLVSKDYNNYLLNGYAGRNSASALASLKLNLSLGRVPRRIVWCMGMNDKDQASAVNTGWMDALNEVIAICNLHRIELILATIPNVPSPDAKNDYKNAVVAASGYRYIDFANAISADGSSTWYDGMMEDTVHPSAQGAMALFNCAVSTVPELLF